MDCKVETLHNLTVVTMVRLLLMFIRLVGQDVEKSIAHQDAVTKYPLTQFVCF